MKQAHKDFILRQMDVLAAYDAKRPQGHTYEFHTHAQRVAQHAKELALSCGYDADMADAIYWATLPHDIGKTALPIAIWDLKEKPTEDQRTERRSHTFKGVEIIRNEFGDTCESDPFLKMMIDITENHHETMDGQGFFGKTAQALSPEVRIVCICDAFDGWSVERPHFGARDISPQGVLNRMTTEKNGQFDNAIFKTFKTMILDTNLSCQSKPSL